MNFGKRRTKSRIRIGVGHAGNAKSYTNDGKNRA